jgi:uncharacterized membrane protein (DUF485 family)
MKYSINNMDSLRVSKVDISIPSEGPETPSSDPERKLMQHPLADNIVPFKYYNNQFVISEQKAGHLKVLKRIVRRSGASAEELDSTLNDINQLVVKSLQANRSQNEETIEGLGKICLLISVILYVLFFVLVILNAYYIDDITLTYAGVISVSFGMIIQLVLMLTNGDCIRFRRNKKVSNMNPRLRNDIMSLLVYANRNLECYSLKWRLDKKGKRLELHQIRQDDIQNL